MAGKKIEALFERLRWAKGTGTKAISVELVDDIARELRKALKDSETVDCIMAVAKHAVAQRGAEKAIWNCKWFLSRRTIKSAFIRAAAISQGRRKGGK